MTVMAIMPVHSLNLVAPLAHKVTARRIEGTAGSSQARPCAVSSLIGIRLRRGDVKSAIGRSTRPATPGSRTSPMATRTTTTRTMPTEPAPSADSTAMFSLEDLVLAYLDCRRTKRNSASALAFEQHLERNLCELRDELASGEYRPGRSICFVVTRPKIREVWAADFRDRIVHHLLYNRVSPQFYASFIADSFACIPGRGTLYGARRLEHHARSVTQNWQYPAWYLKCDLANFFVAIDKRVLHEQLLAKIEPGWWRTLTETILFHDPRTNVDVRSHPKLLRSVPPHKSLFNAPDYSGLPIGNLSSQFFANVYLNDLDQFAKHRIGARRYVRYVDDFVLLHESAQWLHDAHEQIAAFLPERLNARLNPRKTILQPVSRGIDFVGHVVNPWHTATRKRTVRTALRRLEHMPFADTLASGNSYFGLLRQSSASYTDRARLANALRRRGRTVNAAATQTYRSRHE